MGEHVLRLHEDRSTRQRVQRLLETAVVLAALATVPLVIAQEQEISDPITTVADWLIWGIFLADYTVLMLLSPSRWLYVRRNWLSAAILVLSFPLMPALLALVRLARLARLVRLLRLAGVVVRGLGALRLALGRPGLLYLTLATAFLIFAGGGALTLLEPETVKGDFWNGVWWAVVTSTTVGYGDIAPVSVGGRFLGVVIMFMGVGLAATLAASVAAYFVEKDDREKDEENLKALVERLNRIEALLRQSNRGSGTDSGQE